MNCSFLAAFTVTPERWGVINFTLSLDAQPYTFMFARPKQLSRAYLFIQPYTVNVRNKQWPVKTTFRRFLTISSFCLL